MPTFSLILFARTQHVESISIPEEHILLVTIKCTHCNTFFEKDVGICRFDEVEMDKQHGVANFGARCKNCERKGYITIVEPSPYRLEPDEDGIAKGVLINFECRGLEVCKVSLGDYFKVKVKGSPAQFEKADFTDLWCEYDDNISNVAQVQNPQLNLIRNKDK